MFLTIIKVGGGMFFDRFRSDDCYALGGIVGFLLIVVGVLNDLAFADYFIITVGAAPTK